MRGKNLKKKKRKRERGDCLLESLMEKCYSSAQESVSENPEKCMLRKNKI